MLLIFLFGSANVLASGTGRMLSDPTKPATFIKAIDSKEEHSANGFKLSQIYISKNRRFAIINGQQVVTGDLIAGAEVIAIKSDKVHLLIDGLVSEVAIMPSVKQY